MPIYAYRCDECGAEKDVLQKFADAPLTRCTQCGAEAFRKVLTAPAFQLKGSGWYATDFRDAGKAKPEATASGAASPASASAGETAKNGPAGGAAVPAKADATNSATQSKPAATAASSSAAAPTATSSGGSPN